MKRKILATLLCLGCSSLTSLAFADNLFEYSPQAPSNQSNYQVAQMPMNAPQENEGFRARPPSMPMHKNRAEHCDDSQMSDSSTSMKEHRHWMKYNVQIAIATEGEETKIYNVALHPYQEFIVINSKEVPYVKTLETVRHNKKTWQEPVYDKVPTGIAIKGITIPLKDASGADVKMKVFYNDLLGFEKSCWGSHGECVQLPSEVFSTHKVWMQLPYNQPVEATEFTNSKGQKISVAIKILSQENDNAPDSQEQMN